MSSFYEGKTILLIGGLGFIGRRLASRFSEEGANVRIIEKDADKNIKESFFGNENCEIVELNAIENFPALEKHIAASEIIINLIKNRSPDPLKNEEVSNLDFKMLSFCKSNKIKPLFVHFGSRLQYSPDNALPITEEGKIGPTSAYGTEKAKSEAYYLQFNKEEGLPVLCFRIANVYGPTREIKNSTSAK